MIARRGYKHSGINTIYRHGLSLVIIDGYLCIDGTGTIRIEFIEEIRSYL